ncbi:MAG: transcriptional regulator [Algicola sp.]|nr:transcriptional regulator [Algicola sp.]
MNNADFDELIHAPNRLKICAFLSPTGSVEFPVIRDMLQVSDSVLSKHLKHLENAGYVKQRKGSANGRKRSWVYLTTTGRKAFKDHINELQKLIKYSTDT